MNSKKIQILLGILLLIFGLFFSFQLKAVQKEKGKNIRQRDLGKLTQLLEEQNKRVAALEELEKNYQQKLEDYEKRFIKGSKVELLKEELDFARFAGGLTDVIGKGIVIKLDDSKIRLVEGMNVSDTVIHDGQLIEIINILKYAGAQAISINEERIVVSSETQCAGPTVSVNKVRYTVPFIIKAIGDPEYLKASIEEEGGILDLMSLYGIQKSVKIEDNILIPRFKNYLFNSTSIQEIGGKI